jgi:hypothetical protein
MKSFNKYIEHVRKQSEHTKLTHAVVVASICTGVFSAIYLYFVRGVTPPTPEILKIEQVVYEAKS